ARPHRRGRGGSLHRSGAGAGLGAVLRGRAGGEAGDVRSALKLGTRGSTLALWQAEWVRAELARHGVAAELVVIQTRGDADVDRPLHQLEGKGFFTKEIEEALLERRIDVAVHSLKDLPTRLPDGLALAAVPGQGAFGRESRAGEETVRAALAPLEDPASARAVAAERSLLAALGGGCQAPVAAFVGARGSGLGARLFGRVTAQDGSVQITASAVIDERDPAAAGVAVAGLLQAQGASRLLTR